MKVSADKNPDYSTSSGKATQDRLFLLSVKEMNKYLSSNSKRRCKSTDYAVANGAKGNYCSWWLRSPGAYQSYATEVFSTGEIYTKGGGVGAIGAVRPAMWISLA